MNNKIHYMTVIEKHPNGTVTPVMINLHDVDYIESENRTLVYYVGDQKYYQITKLQEMQSLLNEKDSFVSLDRINLVNLKNVKGFDDNLGMVYFDEAKRNSATVARMKQRIYSPLIEKAIAKNIDKQISKKIIKKESKKISQRLFRQQETD